MMETVLVKDIRSGMKNLNLTVIVLEVAPPKQIKEGGEVRTLKVADSTGCINLALWDELGTLLGPGDIVRVTKGYANLFRNCLTLYCSKAGELDKLGEFCMVFNEQLNMSEPAQLEALIGGGSGGGSAGAPTNNGGGVGSYSTSLPRPSLGPPFPSNRLQTDKNSSNSKGYKGARGGAHAVRGNNLLVRPERR